MFPFVHFSKRPWLGPALLLASLVLSSLTNQPFDRPIPSIAPQSDVDYLTDMERHLKGKACEVIAEFPCQDYSLDLSLELDTKATTTTTYQPGEKILVANKVKRESTNTDYQYNVCDQKWELTGTWTESTDVRPKIRSIRCCLTVSGKEGLDTDHLYRRLTYALGLDLDRGDMLQIVCR
jgi:hypothetical protein